MAQKFNPAPHDKHAADPREAATADAEMHARLEAGLIDTSGIGSRKPRAAGADQA
jgi:hypothetical protein